MSVSKEWKLIKSALKRTYNRTVKDYFSDVDDEELEDLTLPRKVLKRCSYIMPKDSMISAILKQQFFWFIVQQLHLKPDLIAGIPKSQYDELYKYKPMITMFFRQDPDAVPDGFYAVEGTISFRLINETTESITEAKLISLANEIKQNFGLNGGYIWKKGKQKYTYKDLEKGLDLRILSISETEAKEVIQKVCDLANATYDNDKLTPIVPNRNLQLVKRQWRI